MLFRSMILMCPSAVTFRSLTRLKSKNTIFSFLLFFLFLFFLVQNDFDFGCVRIKIQLWRHHFTEIMVRIKKRSPLRLSSDSNSKSQRSRDLRNLALRSLRTGSGCWTLGPQRGWIHGPYRQRLFCKEIEDQFGMINFANLFYYLIYFYYYLWVLYIF